MLRLAILAKAVDVIILTHPLQVKVVHRGLSHMPSVEVECVR